jgi:hypothetical protein
MINVNNWNTILGELTLNKISNLQMNDQKFEKLITEQHIKLFVDNLIKKYIII